MLVTALLIALVGLLAGGIVNLLADDLPAHHLPRTPRYPDDAPRPPIAWLGLTAFLFRRRSSPGGARLGWRYPLTEIATSALMVFTVVRNWDSPNASALQIGFYLLYMAIFVLITVIDMEHRLILFAVIIPASVLALLDAILTPLQDRPDLGSALLGGALGFGVFFLLYLGGFIFSAVMSAARKEEITEVAFGYGDVMLIMLSGFILGWQPLIFAMFITVFLGAFGAVAYLTLRLFTGGYSAFTPLPYGPYIVVGTLIMLLFRDEVRALLFSL